MQVKILFFFGIFITHSTTISRSNQTLDPNIVHDAVEANTIKTSEKNCQYKINLTSDRQGKRKTV